MKKFLAIFTVLFLLASCVSSFAYNSKPKPKLKTINNLKIRRLAAVSGTTGQYAAEDLLGNNKSFLLRTYKNYVDAVKALRDGKVRAVIMDEMFANRFLHEFKDLAIMDEALSEENYAIGFNKGNTELLEAVNRVIAEIKADGTLDKIIKKYHSTFLAGKAYSVKPEDIDFNKGAEGGTLVVGIFSGSAPHAVKAGSGFIGIDIELSALIAKKLDKELVITDMDFYALPMAVTTNKVDMICSAMSITEERKKTMDFSDSYSGTRQIALVRADDYEK